MIPMRAASTMMWVSAENAVPLRIDEEAFLSGCI
jgi:hypothetical protein